MGLFSKIIKGPLKLHKKARKAVTGGKRKHKRAGTRSGGKRAATRNARAAYRKVR